MSATDPLADERERLAAGGPGPDLTREFGGGLRWERLAAERPEDDQRRIDLGARWPGTTDAVCFLYRPIETAERRLVTCRAGSDDGLRVWLNGERLVSQEISRPFVAGQAEVRLRLAPGTNHLLVQVSQFRDHWLFQLEREEDGEGREALALAVDDAIDRGLDYLVRTQDLDGSWRYKAETYRNGATALCLYTLLKGGLSPRHQAVRRALAFLGTEDPRKTYSAACQILALSALGEATDLEELERLTRLLLDWQDHGFAYPDGERDLSNTHYAALALHAASERGVSVPPRAWSKLARHVLEYQQEDGGFGYHPRNAPTGSMTAAGCASLALALPILERTRRADDVEEALELGLAWLRSTFRYAFNPEPRGRSDQWTRWHHYYLYGVERVAAFTELEEFDRDWYWRAARHLVLTQGERGEWESLQVETQANTCFSLLFLQRATRARTGERARAYLATYGNDDPKRPLSLRASGDTPLTLWISSKGAEWPAEDRILRVVYEADGAVLATVAEDGGERFSARVTLAPNGSHTVRARAEVARPDGTSYGVESQPLSVEIHEVEDAELLSYAADPGRNLLARAETTARASSIADRLFNATRATDNRTASAWIADPRDASPWIEIEARRAVRANTLLLTPPGGGRASTEERALPLRVRVQWNGRESRELELDPEVRGKHVIELARTVSIRKLRIEILETRAGTGGSTSTGFAEIELQKR